MPRGRKPRLDPVPCPNPQHLGSKVKGNGTRQTASGLRRDYRCTPTEGKPHGFAVAIEVEDAPVALYAPAPPCPVHGRAARRVRNGRYGRPDEPRRQRYRCWPNEPDPEFPKGFHNFTPPLARQHVHGDRQCDACEEVRGVHHGEQVVARMQSWSLRIVAEALEQLASGVETYSSVGRWAWAAAGRSRTRPAKLSAAEKGRRAKLAAWRRACRQAEAAGEPEPPRPAGVALQPLPSAVAARRRRTDADGNELPARRTPSARSAEARNRWHVAADWVEMYAPVLWQPLHEDLLAAEAAEHARRAAMSDQQRRRDGRPQVLLLDDNPVNRKAVFDGRPHRPARPARAAQVHRSQLTRPRRTAPCSEHQPSTPNGAEQHICPVVRLVPPSRIRRSVTGPRPGLIHRIGATRMQGGFTSLEAPGACSPAYAKLALQRMD